MKARGPRRLGRLLPDDPGRIGSYTVVGRIGSGGMGTVYAATGEGLRGYLAVKVVHRRHAEDTRFRERFAAEARLLARVNSPCVARFVGADVLAELPWLATEYVPGPTLRHHVDRHGRLRAAMVRALAVGTADALRAVHGTGVVHRDLQPSNVVLSASGPKLLDFGIAHLGLREEATRWIRVRRYRRAVRDIGLPEPAGPQPPEELPGPRDRLGTPGWTSPEQYRGRPVTAASDVFLWGALVAFAAAGRDPFGVAEPTELARRTVREAPDLDHLPPELEGLVEAAMAKDPRSRPTAPEALDRALGEDLQRHPNRPAAVRAVLDRDWTDVAVHPPKPPRRLF
ncbi:serine/threonine-protein kinase [Nocardiopsis halophila]|uniref:serine/threonine-protein kinase n=1 Tax=Nocardiopsis halophila TaxID=141692 RepID=UPI00034C43F6|nr:serine/threonine-protein kinase [Nocardiopsis halophila]